METCPNHSGLRAEIDNEKGWRAEHMDTTHKDINTRLGDLQDRISPKLTFVISTLTFLLGVFLTIIGILLK